MKSELSIGDQVELVDETIFNGHDKRWPSGSKGMVEEVGDEVTIRMHDSEMSRNASVVACMNTMVRVFRKVSNFN